MLDLHCCAWAFSGCSKQGIPSSCGVQTSHCGGFSCCGVQVLGYTGFSSCGSRALACRLSSYGTQVWLPCAMWALPRPGIEPVSPKLQGGFFTTGPPGKLCLFLKKLLSCSRIQSRIRLYLVVTSLKFSYLIKIKKIFSAKLQYAGFQLLDQGWNSYPLQWKHRVLTTGPPGKSPHHCS